MKINQQEEEEEEEEKKRLVLEMNFYTERYASFVHSIRAMKHDGKRCRAGSLLRSVQCCCHSLSSQTIIASFPSSLSLSVYFLLVAFFLDKNEIEWNDAKKQS